MKIWYEAVCDTHKEFCSIMVDSPLGTTPFVKEESNQVIKEWLRTHCRCNMRIVSEDEDMDFLHDNNYVRVSKLS